MQYPEERWLAYSIFFTDDTHALFKGRAFLSLLYWMLGISVRTNNLLDIQKVSKAHSSRRCKCKAFAPVPAWGPH